MLYSKTGSFIKSSSKLINSFTKAMCVGERSYSNPDFIMCADLNLMIFKLTAN